MIPAISHCKKYDYLTMSIMTLRPDWLFNSEYNFDLNAILEASCPFLSCSLVDRLNDLLISASFYALCITMKS